MCNDDYITAGAALAVSGLSDLFDGVIARQLGQVTELGKMLDPTADKLTLMAVMICVGIKFPSIFPFMVIMIVKEVSMLAAGFFLLKNKKVPPSAKWYGKLATVIFYISIITIIGVKAFCGMNIEPLNIGLMLITATCMGYAMFRYYKIFVLMIRNDKNVN
jgi:cardiolipin synthase